MQRVVSIHTSKIKHKQLVKPEKREGNMYYLRGERGGEL